MKRIFWMGFFAAMTSMHASGCASMSDGEHSHSVRYFHCADTLDAESCHLVRSGAHWASERGYMTVEYPGAGYEFVPGPSRTRFPQGVYVKGFGVMGKVPVLVKHGATVEVNFMPGGVAVRDGELVGIIEDFFVEGR